MTMSLEWGKVKESPHEEQRFGKGGRAGKKGIKEKGSRK